MGTKTAGYHTIGDSCECGANLKEIEDGPNAGNIFCDECEAEWLEEILEYEVEV